MHPIRSLPGRDNLIAIYSLRYLVGGACLKGLSCQRGARKRGHFWRMLSAITVPIGHKFHHKRLAGGLGPHAQPTLLTRYPHDRQDPTYYVMVYSSGYNCGGRGWIQGVGTWEKQPTAMDRYPVTT